MTTLPKELTINKALDKEGYSKKVYFPLIPMQSSPTIPLTQVLKERNFDILQGRVDARRPRRPKVLETLKY